MAALLAGKNAEHLQMKARAADPVEMRRWLDAAPDQLTFEKLKALIEGTA